LVERSGITVENTDAREQIGGISTMADLWETGTSHFKVTETMKSDVGTAFLVSAVTVDIAEAVGDTQRTMDLVFRKCASYEKEKTKQLPSQWLTNAKKKFLRGGD